MNLVQRGGSGRPSRPRVLVGAGGAVVLMVGVLAGALGAAGGRPAASPGSPGWITLPQAAPHLPADASQLGAAPSGQQLELDVVLAGQDPAGLAQTVAAVSTPGSPDYRHYLSAAQYAAQFGPSPAEVAQVSSTLRSQGLTVGTPEPGSALLPVSGTVSVVSAALGTPLESVKAPGASSRTIVNTAPPQIPASLGGAVTGVVGLDGVFQEHAMIKQAPAGTSESPESPESPEIAAGDRRRRGPEPGRHRPRRHPAGLPGRPAESGRRQLHLDTAVLGLRPRPGLRAGTHRDRAVHRHRGVRAVRRQ